MTYRKFRYFLELASAADITTLGELKEFKTRHGVRTNDELFQTLYATTKQMAR